MLAKQTASSAKSQDAIALLITDHKKVDYDAQFTVLGEYVNHHIKEEQDEMFPKVKKAKVDLKDLGAQIAERKQELMVEMGLGDEEEEEETSKRTSRRMPAKSR